MMTTTRPATPTSVASLLLTALLCALPSASSLAQVAPPVAPQYGPGYGYGPTPGAIPGQFPMSPGYQHQPGYQHRMPRPTYSGRAAPRSRQMPTLIKDMTDAGYRLTIRLTPQQQPQDIKIEARGHSLIIRSAQTQITRSEQSPTQGRGYSRHFSVSSRRFQRRIRVPADANLSAMTRSDENQAVVVILPRN